MGSIAQQEPSLDPVAVGGEEINRLRSSLSPGIRLSNMRPAGQGSRRLGPAAPRASYGARSASRGCGSRNGGKIARKKYRHQPVHSRYLYCRSCRRSRSVALARQRMGCRTRRCLEQQYRAREVGLPHAARETAGRIWLLRAGLPVQILERPEIFQQGSRTLNKTIVAASNYYL